MFSYRHAYHAGNHADVLKHITLIALLKYLTEKDKALACIDTHAGLGVYELSSKQAQTSGEAQDGIWRLQTWAAGQPAASLAPAITAYLDLIQGFDARGKTYPGSPFIMHKLLRMGRPATEAGVQDRLHLYELNPRDARLLQANVDLLPNNYPVSVSDSDGFMALKSLLPPPARRALVHIDPSYEMKTDYAEVARSLEDALKRFATGCYAIWYPIVGRAEAHELPKRLKKIAATAGRTWLHATLNVGSEENQGPQIKTERTATGRYIARAVNEAPGLRESGVFIVNPPFTLAPQLQVAMPQLQAALGQGPSAGFLLEASA